METCFVGLSNIGKVRGQNQDAIFVPPPGRERVFVLADGMGGASGGEVASQLAVASIPGAYAAARQTLAAGEGLRQAVEKASSAIHEQAARQIGLRGMGTTVVALVLENGMAVLANVGDSRGYLWRQGRLRQVTQDHSLVQQMVAQGSLKPQEAREHHLRNVLTRVLGNSPQVEVDLFELALEPGDLFLMCSDGLHGQVEDTEISQILSSTAPLEERARLLVESANSRGGPDNISVILVAVDGLSDVVEDDSMTPTAQVVSLAAASAGQVPNNRRDWQPWLLLLLLAAIAGGIYFWAAQRPTPRGPGQEEVLLVPVGPTAEARQTSAPSQPPPRPDGPPSTQEVQP